MEKSKRNQQGGFSIIEFLLVLTAFVIFLGAAFIGYRTLKANGNETQIANRFKLFATGLKNYSKDFYNSYPYVTCNNSNAWMTGTAPANNIASCAALEQYIGSFVAVGPDTTHVWTYTGYTGNIGAGIAATSSTGANVPVIIPGLPGSPITAPNVSATQGYYTFTTAPIDNAYVQAILNQANAYGLSCSTLSYNTASSMISCTSQPVLVSGSNTLNYF